MKTIFPQTEVTASESAYGLIELKGENGTIYFNGNGIFDKHGERCSDMDAKKALGLFVELEKMEN
jgi:hypothetical protein